ncbi:hypothetical protein CYMTET_48634, partial [Cymbomonas tetramitiformis]
STVGLAFMDSHYTMDVEGSADLQEQLLLLKKQYSTVWPLVAFGDSDDFVQCTAFFRRPDLPTDENAGYIMYRTFEGTVGEGKLQFCNSARFGDDTDYVPTESEQKIFSRTLCISALSQSLETRNCKICDVVMEDALAALVSLRAHRATELAYTLAVKVQEGLNGGLATNASLTYQRMLGEHYEAQRDYTSAIVAYKALLRRLHHPPTVAAMTRLRYHNWNLNTDVAIAWEYLGLAYKRKGGETENAKRAYKMSIKVLESKPATPEVFNGIMSWYSKLYSLSASVGDTEGSRSWIYKMRERMIMEINATYGEAGVPQVSNQDFLEWEFN